MFKLIIIFEIVIVGFFYLSSFALADVVVLKSGKQVEGKILERTDDHVKIDAGVGVAVTYYADEIDSIDGKKNRNSRFPNAFRSASHSTC